MAKYYKSIDAVDISSGGGTNTGSTVNVDDQDLVQIQIEGDSDSSNVDLEVQGKTGPKAVFGDYDTSSFTAEDLTGNTNNSKVYPYDVSGLSEIKPKIRNNNSNNTTITVTLGVTID